MSGRDRRMRGKDAVLAHGLQIAVLRACQRIAAQRLLQQRKRQQCGVALIHVIDAHVVFQRLQHAEAAQPQDHLLNQPVVGVAAIEMVGDAAIPRLILFQVGVQHVDRDGVPGHALHVIAPGADMHRAPFDIDGHARLFLSQPRLWIPGLGVLGLTAVSVEHLTKVAFAVHQRDGGQRQTHVGRGAQRVAGQHTQAAAVGGHAGVNRDLHGKVADHAFTGCQRN